jgi:copper resistance protein C
MTHRIRAVLTIGVGTGMIMTLAAPAAAQSSLLRANPAAGAVVRRPVSAVILTFNEVIRSASSTVVVTGPGRTIYGRGKAEAVDQHLTQKVYPPRSGVYQVSWQVVSARGQATGGVFTFTVSLSPSSEPTVVPPRLKPADTAGNRKGSNFWSWLGLTALVVVLLL